MKINTDILPKWWSIVVWIIILLFTQGCYTQLSMFHPEIENDDSEEFYSYSVAGPMKSVGIYAQDGAGQSLGMAYQTMYNRFSGFSGYGNGYNYYNPYYNYNGGYYNNSYTLGGYTMHIPYTDLYKSGEKKIRTWTRDTKSPGTNLTVTRTRTNTSESSNNDSGQTNSTSSSSTSSSSTSSSSTSSSSTSSSGGRRVTRRN